MDAGTRSRVRTRLLLSCLSPNAGPAVRRRGVALSPPSVFTRLRRFAGRIATITILTTAATLSSGCRTSPSYDPLPPDALAPVLGIARFDNRSGYEGQWSLGTGMSDLLVDELVRSERFTVVDRQELDHVARELALQDSAMFRDEGRANPGRLLNARFLIRGTITEFSQVRGYGVSAAWRWFRFFGRTSVARVAIALSVVDVESGEILGSVVSDGEAAAREAFAQAAYGELAFGGDAWFRTPLGRATRDAIDNALVQLVDAVPVANWVPVIAGVDTAGRVVLNGGHDRGFSNGQRFVARARAAIVTDPLTGDVLERTPGPIIATVRIIEVRNRTAIAIVEGASRDLARGQRLERVR